MGSNTITFALTNPLPRCEFDLAQQYGPVVLRMRSKGVEMRYGMLGIPKKKGAICQDCFFLGEPWYQSYWSFCRGVLGRTWINVCLNMMNPRSPGKLGRLAVGPVGA